MNVLSALTFKLFDRFAIQGSVVALAKAVIAIDLEIRVAERQLRGLDGTTEIGREHRVDALARPALSQLTSEQSTPLGKPAVEPAGGDATFVVLTQRLALRYSVAAGVADATLRRMR